MRPLLAACLSATLLVGTAFAPLAQAADCVRPAEHEAFDVTGLKNELMVVAIACQNTDNYNAFIGQFRSTLQSEERSLTNYFNRTSHRPQQAHDDYITSLANAQSQESLKRGTLFCTENTGLYSEVRDLKSARELVSYASGKHFVQPIDVVDCPAPAPKAAPKVKPKKTTTANNN
jgi:hypothetical protein